MPLSDLQLTTATIVLAVPEAHGFALAGGAALVIHEVVDRGTQDLDCFGPSTGAVNALVDPAIDALTTCGLTVATMVRNDGFAKLLVKDDSERTQVDLGFDPALLDPVQSIVGPVRHLRDLAGDKLLALFARAASRDFVDVAGLLRRFGHDELCELAAAGASGESSIRSSSPGKRTRLRSCHRRRRGSGPPGPTTVRSRSSTSAWAMRILSNGSLWCTGRRPASSAWSNVMSSASKPRSMQ